MSVKPIDFHLTYANTIRESKDKQNDVHRPKDTNHYIENKIQAEVKKNLQRTTNTEETKHKAIANKEKDKNSSKKNEDNKKRRKSSKEEIEKECNRNTGIGTKLDIMI
ncbi:hypothetical protein [Alkaliphilus peptidifermentans]|uniref:Uncharacterized protein n=1 Tax=Alkaliphilus peptidifermentans DSM 18978 TaxID=1120976 RepID=A0A1G5DFM9_9FIRM|nr:hypothetical protein [Alkaliphilus peptidifermentans]SCY13190.1 hypothetical protein SAMN03080606_00887 [Alkaliphilus peptidifermentans DSM 18978]